MFKQEIGAIVVVAGMEGALASIVASMVDIQVVGVPTSIGYGFGANGVGRRWHLCSRGAYPWLGSGKH